MRVPDCGNVDVTDESIDPANPPAMGETEHPFDVSITHELHDEVVR